MCVRPHTVIVQSRTFGTKRVITAPCGYCIECVKKRQNDWKMRISHECNYWPHVFFFTLTYRDSALPCSICYDDVYDSSVAVMRKPQAIEYCSKHDYDYKSTVYIKDVQDFIKRMRTDIQRKSGSQWNVKYFICSEYGPNPRGTKRPHYHGILMTDIDYNTLVPYFSTWATDYGRMEFVEVGIHRADKSSVANYVSKYCSKGCFESRLDDIRHKHISRAKSVMSHGIGERWLTEHANDYLNHVPSFVDIQGDYTVEDVERLWINYLHSDIWHELDRLIDNMRVYDGDTYSYSLPRYYKERLFCVRKTFINYVSTNKPCIRYAPGSDIPEHYCYKPNVLTYEAKLRKDSRYVHESFLSCAIALRLSQRALARDRKNREAFQESYYTDANGSIHSTYEDYKRASLLARESVATASLSNFYMSNMWKHRRLDFDADTYTAEDYTNFFIN